MNPGNVAELRGEYGRSREYLTASLDTFDQVGRQHHAAVARLNLGDLLTTLGEYEAAGTRLGAALGAAERVDNPRPTGTAHTEQARLALSRGCPDEAESLCDRALDCLRDDEDPIGWARTRHTLGDTKRAQDEYDQAVEHLSAALDVFLSSAVLGDAPAATESAVELPAGSVTPSRRDWCERLGERAAQRGQRELAARAQSLRDALDDGQRRRYRARKKR